MFCREQAVQVHREREAIEKKGARLVFVGNGNRHFAKAFKDEFSIEAPIYVDTERLAYRALGMKRSLLGVLTPGVVGRAVRALRSGARQTTVQGDALQLGGVLVVRPGGKVAFAHLSEAVGDHPDVADVLEAIPA